MGRPLVQRDFPFADVGARIRDARLRKGISQTEAAQAVGFKFQAMWQKIESGKQPPSIDVMRKLVGILDITPNQLLLGDAVASPRTSKAARPEPSPIDADIPDDWTTSQVMEQLVREQEAAGQKPGKPYVHHEKSNFRERETPAKRKTAK